MFLKKSLFVGLIGGLLSNAALAQITLPLQTQKQIATIDERFQSYNIEMCEVIGGNFWVPYSKLDSVRKNTTKKGFEALKWQIEPINLYEKKLRNLAKALGPVYFRVSGTWANALYFQNNDLPASEIIPNGFRNILTRNQWKGVIDFNAAIGGKLVTSFPISDGMRDAKGIWQANQIQELLNFTKSIGGNISAAEFFNEPSHANHGDAPKGYTGINYAKEFKLFKNYISIAAPTMKILGPGSTGESILPSGLDISVDQLLSNEPKPTFDVFTYHYYGDVSKRCFGKQKIENALSEEWLSRTEKGLAFYQNARDKYNPNAPIWLTETAESACGGNPWASAYLDSFRYVEQLGRLARKNVQVVMHNTLTRSEYGLLDQDTHDPRPSYWAAVLWAKLMGNKVFEGAKLDQGIDMFVHNLKGNPSGKAVLIVNRNDAEKKIIIPSNATQFTLTAIELQAKTVQLNGKELQLTKTDNLPELNGKPIKKGTLSLPPFSINFLTFNSAH